jgi:hypothetical protein
MADNVRYNEPANGTMIATDDLGGGVQIQRVKAAFGGDGSAADVAAANPLPVCVGITADIAGLATYFAPAASNVVQAVKSGPGRLLAVHAANKDAATRFLQIFDAPAANIVLGATTPKLSLAIPPGDFDQVFGQLELDTAAATEFATAIALAVTTTPTGSGAPTTGVVLNVWYK